MRCGTIRRALCANKDQTADCTWSRKHICVTRTTRTCPNIRDLILKCTKTHESAQLGLGTQICVIILAILGLGTRTREVRERIVIKQSNAAQKSKNQIPLVIPPYHTTPKKNQNNQNTGSIPVNLEHCARVTSGACAWSMRLSAICQYGMGRVR